MAIKICVCLIFLSCFASGLCGYDTTGAWRIERQSSPFQYQQPRLPRPPPYYSYNTYVQGYATPKKPTNDSPGNPIQPKIGGGTGISHAAAPDCAPGIPRCVPRVGR